MSGYSKSRGELRYYQLECQETGRELGRGSYATVVELTHKGLRCAGKKIYRVLFSQNNLEGHVERFTHECRLISELRHPNIVQFLGVYFEPQQEVPVLVLEYLPLTLAQCLDQYGTPPPEIGYLVLSDVALGLRFLHERSPPIIHRDLSANNVLLAEDFSAKISDLGVAKMVNIPAACVSTMTRVPGTPCYMPPEALVPDPKYDSTIDVFSYGILILHTFSGKWPIPSEPSRVDPAHPHQLVAVSEADRRLAYIEAMGSGSNSGCGQAARGGREATHPLTTLARACLHNNPGQRPSSKEIWEKVSEVSGRHKLSYRDKLQLLLKMVDGGAREGQGQVGGGGVAAATAAAAAGGAGLTAGRDVSPWSTKPSSREKVNVSSREGVNANTGREGVNANTGREGVNANTGREGVNANTGREGVNATSGREGITATSGREGGGVTTAAVVNEKKKKTPPKKAEKPPSGGGGGGRGGGGGAERSLKDIWEERMQPKSPEKSQRADELFPKPSQQKEARARALEGLTGNRGVREGLTGGGREGLTGGGGGGGGEGLMGKAGKKRNVADNWLANLSKDTPTTSKSQAPQRKTSQGSDNKPHPPAAQEVEKKTFAVVMYDFEARAEHKDELTVYAGEEVEILGGEECMEDPWVMVKKGNQTGSVPSSYVHLKQNQPPITKAQPTTQDTPSGYQPTETPALARTQTAGAVQLRRNQPGHATPPVSNRASIAMDKSEFSKRKQFMERMLRGSGGDDQTDSAYPSTRRQTETRPAATAPTAQHHMNRPPAPIPEEVESVAWRGRQEVYVALFDYIAADEDEISFRKGDEAVEVCNHDGGWMEGRIRRTGYYGMIPCNYFQLKQ